ncbi:MAG TPA: SpoIID/LytB domain-containing protein [Clostridia bacterium]|nr:SpoIID/LytB domain-containing protein [Clostridia bacterium]
MLKGLFRKAAAALVAAAVMLSSAPVPASAGSIPDVVRVGLYYKDSSVNTAQSVFDLSAQAGIMLGFQRDENFTEIYRASGPSVIYIRKDGYYYNSGSGLKEYDPSASPASGIKYGPYHIKIGSDYSDQATASAQADLYRQSGVQAFVAYADVWQVWTGSYESDPAAQTEMNNIRNLLGELGYAVIQPSSGGVIAVDGQYQPICAFVSGSAFFQARPAPENDPPVINIKGKQYRGAIEVKRLSTSDMTVINVVTMQEYLYGNVPPEIGGKSPAEALKAQAIASKMYVINNMGKHGKTGFDVCPTTSCQVYKGFSSETPQGNAAIDEVKDKVITYNGKPAGAIFYFASGGGSTEDVRNVWGSSYPYLVSVEDKYEKIYTWTKTLRASDVRAKLPELGNILGIAITQTAPRTGRVTELAVTGTSRGEPQYFPREKTRTLFGLDSQLYTITTDADVFAATLSNAPIASAGLPSGSIADASANIAENAVAIAYANDTDENGMNSANNLNSANGGDSGNSSISPAGNTTPQNDPHIQLPASSTPLRTQLGGKKVVTASGVVTLTASNNKITILGANGNTKKATVVPETYTFTGKGWGHAVGMSQEGAIGMGKAGFTYDQILMHFFQGTQIEG